MPRFNFVLVLHATNHPAISRVAQPYISSFFNILLRLYGCEVNVCEVNVYEGNRVVRLSFVLRPLSFVPLSLILDFVIRMVFTTRYWSETTFSYYQKDLILDGIWKFYAAQLQRAAPTGHLDFL